MLVVLVALGLQFPGSSVASGPHWRSLSGQCDNLPSCNRAVYKTARAAPALVINYQPVRTVRAGVTSAKKPHRPIRFNLDDEIITHEVDDWVREGPYGHQRFVLPAKVIPSAYLWENIIPGFPDPIIDLAVARFKAVTLANGIGIVARWPKAGDSHMTDVMDNDPLEPIAHPR